MRRPRSAFVHTVSRIGVGVGVGVGALACGNASSGSASDATTNLDVVEDAQDDSGPGVDVADLVDAKNPSECPKDDPGFGMKYKPCTAASSVHCSYPDRCDLRPADAGPPINVYFCHASAWTLLVDYTPDCPATEPKVGAPCPCSPHMLYVACLYGTCEGLDRRYDDCQTADTFDDAWKSTPVSCNPPEPGAGPDGG